MDGGRPGREPRRGIKWLLRRVLVVLTKVSGPNDGQDDTGSVHLVSSV